ncbi:unnamed protein product [Didymodactylos carnosus]|uniref:EGF-like domain-containing protein n=1 Tax=Didymodactylos carnosus TaxID=1234261 RepID=A0A8S2F342_9BILA|nr:unnamed protein product [Didymodactylos carnosus]CAF4151281.1 unnamed protein product [Didymodactylos carnosus]
MGLYCYSFSLPFCSSASSLRMMGFDFKCYNSTTTPCIPYNQQCKSRCEMNEDSLLCDKYNLVMDPNNSELFKINRCDGKINYIYANNDEYYCDPDDPKAKMLYRQKALIQKSVTTIRLPFDTELLKRSSSLFVSILLSNMRKAFKDDKLLFISLSYEQRVQYHNYVKRHSLEAWSCNRGISVRKEGIIECFCPPSTYGRYCQYYSDRITVIVSVHNIINVKIMVTLWLDENMIDSEEFVVNSNTIKYKFYLIYSKPKLMNGSYFVQIEAFSSTVPLSLLSVWQYSIKPFVFLPAYRLSTIVKFSSILSPANQHICNTILNPCKHNSTCFPIQNKINDSHAFYCHCHNNTYGKTCENNHNACFIGDQCSPDAICRPPKSKCICPVNQTGPTCHLKHSTQKWTHLCLNGGSADLRNGLRSLKCLCNRHFHGDYCQYSSGTVNISLKSNSSSYVRLPSSLIMRTIVQLVNIKPVTDYLDIRQQKLFKNIPLEINFNNNDLYIPLIGLLKLSFRSIEPNNSIQHIPEYFLLYISPYNSYQPISFKTDLNSSNYCPHAYTIEELTSSQLEFLTPSADKCSNCLAGGECLQGDLTDKSDFECICPWCYYGSICQHNSKLYSINLESLLTNDLFSSSSSFTVYICIPIILFLIGLISNFFCILTFNRPKPCLVGTGYYLLINSFTSQISLFVLLLKILYILLSIKRLIVNDLLNDILCKSLTFMLSVSTRISYWITAFVNIERVYVTQYPTGQWLKNPIVAKYLIIALFVILTGLHVHEAMYHNVVPDPKYTKYGKLNIRRMS